jgi:hypothetical protein
MSEMRGPFDPFPKDTAISDAPLDYDFGRLTPAEREELERLSAKTNRDNANVHLLTDAEKYRWFWLACRIWKPNYEGNHGTGKLTDCRCWYCTHYSIYHKGDSNV